MDNNNKEEKSPQEKMIEEAREITLSIYETQNGKAFFKLFEKISGVNAPAMSLTDNQLREQEGKRQLYVFFKQFIGE